MATLTNEQLLEKATMTTGDFGGAGEAPLSIEQVKEFIKLLAAPQTFLSDVRRVTANAAKWQESIVDFGGRITRSGTEGTRLEPGERAKANTGNVEISTVLLRAEVPISDEVLEDNVAQSGFANDLEQLIANQFGFDVEELMVQGDTSSADPYLAQLNGWLKQAQGASGHVLNAELLGQDYATIFRKLINSLPNRFKRNTDEFRLYVPVVLEELYKDVLASRGTALGDQFLMQGGNLTYQGYQIKGAATIPVSNSNTCSVLLTNKNNLYAGFRRSMTLETWRDPREGATSFIVTARVDAKIAIPAATAIATNVSVAT